MGPFTINQNSVNYYILAILITLPITIYNNLSVEKTFIKIDKTSIKIKHFMVWMHTKQRQLSQRLTLKEFPKLLVT